MTAHGESARHIFLNAGWVRKQPVGAGEGSGDGGVVGTFVGSDVGIVDGTDVGSVVGTAVGEAVGIVDGRTSAAAVGTAGAAIGHARWLGRRRRRGRARRRRRGHARRTSAQPSAPASRGPSRLGRRRRVAGVPVGTSWAQPWRRDGGVGAWARRRARPSVGMERPSSVAAVGAADGRVDGTAVVGTGDG